MFTKQIVTDIAKDIEAALKDVEKKHNVQIKRAGGSFTNTNYTMKLDVSAKDESGKAVSKYAESWNQLAHLYGFEKSDLGKSISTPNGTYKIVGLNSRASAMPIILEKDGKQYKMAADYVKKFLK